MKFEAIKDEYYAIRGWDKETGIPTEKKPAELGLASASLDADPEGLRTDPEVDPWTPPGAACFEVWI